MPPPRTVAGVVLRPFCLGHHLHFKALGLPFAGNADADCGREDLIAGIAVCGMTSEGCAEAIRTDTLADVIDKWRKAVRGPWYAPRFLDWDEVEASFREYLAAGYDMPPMWNHLGAGVSLSAPWEVLLKVRLTSAGFTESEVLNGYLPARWYEYFALLELEAVGRCPDQKQWKKMFFTKEDAEKMEAVRGN
jgi:hypothetical protein